MSPNRAFDVLSFLRKFIIDEIDSLDDQQIVAIPQGFSNNILWNAGHIVYSTCSSTYRPSGKELPIPNSYKKLFMVGTSPVDWEQQPSVGEVVLSLRNLDSQMRLDFDAGVFSSFEAVPNGELILGDLTEALALCIGHEGEHSGRISSLRKLV